METNNNIRETLMAKYDNVWQLQHNTYKVVYGKKYGFFDADGKQIIPFMYDWASCFVLIKLYGRTFVGAYVTKGEYKTIIDIKNRNAIVPMKNSTMYFIINDKLWVQDETGYNLLDCKGRKLLQTKYESIINDRFRQPKNVYLVRKNGRFGAVHICRNNKEYNILPFVYQNIAFWYSPALGVMIEASMDGKKKGLYKQDGSVAIPERYEKFEYQTPFRKVFILACSEESDHTLYVGEESLPIISSNSYIHSQYVFYLNKKSFYNIYTTAKELLIDENNQVIADIDKRQYTSSYYYLMNMCNGKFKFTSLKSLLRYAKEVKNGNIKLTPFVARELVVYGYYFMEEILCEYALMHGFEYTHFTLHDNMKNKIRTTGLCDTKVRSISLNINLLFTSEKIIRMIIMHELLHLRIPNHRKKFYKTLNSLCGFDTQKVRFPERITLMDAVDAIGILKQKKKSLFAKAQQQGVELFPQSHVVPVVSIGKNKLCNEYMVAACKI